jgi:hypothetical protein
MGLQIGGDAGLGQIACGRSVDPVIVSRRTIISAKFSSTFGPGQKGDLHQPPVIGQRLDVARQIAAPDHVQDQVCAALGAQRRRNPRPW